jgi:hypothetical protein
LQSANGFLFGSAFGQNVEVNALRQVTTRAAIHKAAETDDPPASLALQYRRGDYRCPTFFAAVNFAGRGRMGLGKNVIRGVHKYVCLSLSGGSLTPAGCAGFPSDLAPSLCANRLSAGRPTYQAAFSSSSLFFIRFRLWGRGTPVNGFVYRSERPDVQIHSTPRKDMYEFKCTNVINTLTMVHPSSSA